MLHCRGKYLLPGVHVIQETSTLIFRYQFQVLNALLQIPELAFKNSNQEIRKAGYLSWRVLMDNFALDPQVLSSSKRIKLITRPLVVSIILNIFERQGANHLGFVITIIICNMQLIFSSPGSHWK